METLAQISQSVTEMVMNLSAFIIALGFIALSIWIYVKILHKAGYSGWWVLLTYVPLLNVVMVWIFAFSDWPALKKDTTSKKSTVPHSI